MVSKYKLVSNSFYIGDTDIPKNKYDIKDSFEGADECLAFSLLEEEQK